MQRDRAHRIDSVMLQFGVERRGFHAQKSRRLRLIAAATLECACDQLNLVPLNLAVEIDAVVIKNDLFVAAALVGKFGLQSFDLAGESFGKQC